ncbi:MAG: TrkH family potassium uptake protein [Oceanospirillaceae bacterium]
MHYRIILRILGILLMVFSITMIPPAIVSHIYDDGVYSIFYLCLAITFSTGFLFWLPAYNVKEELRTRDGFVVTVMFWLVLSIFGAIPFVLAQELNLSIVDAVFESMSGLTTTGATVITGIDDLPKSILFYRQQLQWLGGMGIIVLAVAILPMLGIGGMQLYRAETPGPVKDSKLTPRITETAKALWYIYATLTVVCTLSYWLAGMSFFDAISHSFSTVAIGGFSTHDASIGYFNSPLIESIAVIFMLISAVNFGLHFFAWRRKSIFHYWQDPEVKFFIYTLTLTILVSVSILYMTSGYSATRAIRDSVFMVVSIATTTGFATTDFAIWPTVLPFMLMLTAFAGGCAGSTAGGMKIIRVLLIFKQGHREIKRLVHPNAIFSVKLSNKPIAEKVLQAVWGFFSVYMLVFVIMLLAIMATGIDQITAWSAVAATLNNLGPGLGSVAANYGDVNDTAKWILCFSMLLGRLEVFTLIILFTPIFWRR